MHDIVKTGVLLVLAWGILIIVHFIALFLHEGLVMVMVWGNYMGKLHIKDML